ncbi:MAG: agglutinin biogenesis protein MshI [Betaproteobacteria bacterium HGW-Betaproteobacteria-22]|nr:MAG: agglutinin biogenesis protein MshI [Betaproteobacteria bacterium HGW-Betaproteobacteria-22]
MKLFSKQKKQGWLVICSENTNTQIVHVSRLTRQKPVVEIAKTLPGTIQDQAVLQAINAELDLNRFHCTLLLTQGDYHIFQLEKPNIPANEIKQAVSWKLKDMIDYPVEQATIDVVDIPADQGKTNRQSFVYAIAARNERIGDYMQRFNALTKAGLEVIDIPEMAQRNIASYLEQENRGLALLSINSKGCLLTFTANQELYYARQIDLNTDAFTSDDSEQKSNLYERLGLEIQRSLDNFERQFPQLAINRLALAPFEGREDFYDYLTSYLYIQVDRFELSDVFNFEVGTVPESLAEQAALLPLLGAALRDEVAR